MLELNNISKIYENKRGIKDVSLTAQPGEVLAILGPNGSGKTTTLKIIAGIMKPDQGSCTLGIYDTMLANTKKAIGFLPDEPFLYESLTAQEFLYFVLSMKESENNLSIENLLEEFDLFEFRNQKLKSFSFGMKKRVALLSTILTAPQLLILDEPTNGLDTKSILMMKKHISLLKKNGSIIIISSHVLDFVSKIADGIAMLKDGIIVKKASTTDNLEQIYSEIYF